MMMQGDGVVTTTIGGVPVLNLTTGSVSSADESISTAILVTNLLRAGALSVQVVISDSIPAHRSNANTSLKSAMKLLQLKDEEFLVSRFREEQDILVMIVSRIAKNPDEPDTTGAGTGLGMR